MRTHEDDVTNELKAMSRKMIKQGQDSDATIKIVEASLRSEIERLAHAYTIQVRENE